jgi:hypothetical protein
MSSNTDHSQALVKYDAGTCPSASSNADAAHFARLKQLFPSVSGCSIGPNQSRKFEFKEGSRVWRPTESGIPAGFIEAGDSIACFPNGAIGADDITKFNDLTFTHNDMTPSDVLVRNRQGQVSAFTNVEVRSRRFDDGSGKDPISSLLFSNHKRDEESEVIVEGLKQLLEPEGDRPSFIGTQISTRLVL